MTSINDLLSNLTQQNPISPRDRPETWRLHFVVASASRLWRDDRALLEALVHEGFEVHVIAHDDGVLGQLADHGVRTCALPPCDELVRGTLLAPALFPIILGHMVEHPPTLVHIEGEPLLWLVTLATRQLDDPPLVVGTLRGLPAPAARLGELLPDLASAPLAQLDAAYWSYLSARIDAFLTTSRMELARHMERTPFDSKKLEVWTAGSGYDHVHFDPARRDLPTREELRAMAEVPGAWTLTVGVAGDYEPDVELLGVAIKKLAALRPDIGWLVARIPGKQTPAALEALSEHIIWLEPGEQGMPLFVSACDVYFSPRRTPRHATTLLEAQAMGTPTVAFATEFASSVILDGETGALVGLERTRESRHHARAQGRAAAERLAVMCEDVSLLEKLGAQAKVRAINKFTRAAAHDQLMRIYDRLLSRRYSI